MAYSSSVPSESSACEHVPRSTPEAIEKAPCLPGLDVVAYYAAHFVPAFDDLSSSSLESGELAAAYPALGELTALRAAIASRYPGLVADDVVVTNGASEALAACALALLGAGDDVSVHAGVYPSFVRVAERLGATLRPEDEFTGPSVMRVVNNPTVPNGRLLDIENEIEDVERFGGRLIADEVYLDLVDGTPAPRAACVSPRAISVADLSKPLGLGGLRIGWVATRDRGALAAISRWVQLLSGGPSVLAVNSALDAMRRFGELRESHLARARKNTPALLRLLKRAGWHVELAAAGATLLARPPVPLSPEQLERLRENGLFLLPSDVFGISGGVRVSRYADPGLLDRALCLLGDTQARSLVILAKAPLPGYAKTRLAAAIGLEGTRLLAQAFLQDTLSVAAAVPTSQIIAFTPRKSRAFFASSAPGARLIPQPDGDLGERISSALNAALEESSAAVLIGTDTPDLLPSIIDRAFRALEWSDLVLGPAEDGGFYLIGVRGRLPRALFDRVEWSTSAVFARVAANAECLGLSAEALDPWLDVDDLPSLQALELRLAKHSRAPRTRAALARLTAELPDGA